MHFFTGLHNCAIFYGHEVDYMTGAENHLATFTVTAIWFWHCVDFGNDWVHEKASLGTSCVR